MSNKNYIIKALSNYILHISMFADMTEAGKDKGTRRANFTLADSKYAEALNLLKGHTDQELEETYRFEDLMDQFPIITPGK